jgi:hypothetical protein
MSLTLSDQGRQPGSSPSPGSPVTDEITASISPAPPSGTQVIYSWTSGPVWFSAGDGATEPFMIDRFGKLYAWRRAKLKDNTRFWMRPVGTVTIAVIAFVNLVIAAHFSTPPDGESRLGGYLVAQGGRLWGAIAFQLVVAFPQALAYLVVRRLDRNLGRVYGISALVAAITVDGIYWALQICWLAGVCVDGGL